MKNTITLLGLAWALALFSGCTKSFEDENAALKAAVAAASQKNSELTVQLASVVENSGFQVKRIADLEEQLRKLTPLPQFELTGEMFIATKGGVSYKLGAVDIGIYPRAQIDAWIKERRTAQLAALAEISPPAKKASHAAEDAWQKYQECSDAYIKALQSPIPKIAEEVAPRFERTRQAKAAMDAAEAEMKEKKRVAEQHQELMKIALSGLIYFEGLPPAMKSARTNSDGRFSIKLERGREYAIAARAQRVAGDSTERYYWIVPAPKADGDRVEILLTNTNLNSAGGGSLITEEEPPAQ